MKYGFVYLWFDRKLRKFYLGCHWGREDDGYVCSSEWMLRAYSRRRQDFKRRVIARVYGSRKELLEKEFHYLSMIRSEELCTKYYNKNNHHFGHWTCGDQTSVIEKFASKLKDRKLSEETRKKMSIAKRGSKLKGKRTMAPMSEEHKQKIAGAHRGKRLSEEHKKKLSLAKIGNKNRVSNDKF